MIWQHISMNIFKLHVRILVLSHNLLVYPRCKKCFRWFDSSVSLHLLNVTLILFKTRIENDTQTSTLQYRKHTKIKSTVNPRPRVYSNYRVKQSTLCLSIFTCPSQRKKDNMSCLPQSFFYFLLIHFIIFYHILFASMSVFILITHFVCTNENNKQFETE